MRTSARAFAVLTVLGVAIAGCGGAEARKDRYLQHGQEYFDARNFEKARIEFSNALQIDPKNAQARYMAGRVAEKLDNPREAVGQYQAAIDEMPGHAGARAALARLLLFAGLPDKSIEIVTAGLELEPQNPELLTARGAARARMGDTESAFADAQKAIELQPADEYTIALLASLYRQSARSDKAIEVVRAGLEHLPDNVDLRTVLADLEMGQQHPAEAETQLRKVIELEPDELPHRYRLARFYIMSKNVDAAENVLREAVAQAPDNLQPKLALVEMLAAQRGAEQAEAQLQEFVKADSGNYALKLEQAGYFEKRSDGKRAEAIYREIVTQAGLRPDGLTARNRLAALLVGRKELEAAGSLIEEVLKENPRDADALTMRGNLALARGDAAAAIIDLRAVLRDQPNSVPLLRALARAHLQNKEVALAEETLRSAAQANPKDPNIAMDLAQVLAQTGKGEQARSMLEQQVAAAPGNFPALEMLFRLQMGQKDLAAARATAQAMQAERPDMALGFYAMGTVEEAEGKLDAATRNYERALEIQPNGAEPLTALVRVDIARKQPERALARLDAVLGKHPDNGVALNLKGEMLVSLKRYDDAVRVFDAAIVKAPQWWVPYRGLAAAHLASRRSDAAVDALKTGVMKTGGATSLAFDLASLYERLSRPDDAIKVYEEMIAKDPASSIAVNNLAMLLVSYREDKPSLDRAQQLTDKLASSNEPAILNTRGWVKYKNGAYQEALPLLQQAVEKSPGSPIMHYHLGMAQLKTGDAAAARKSLEAAVAAERPFLGVDEARAALDQIRRSG